VLSTLTKRQVHSIQRQNAIAWRWSGRPGHWLPHRIYGSCIAHDGSFGHSIALWPFFSDLIATAANTYRLPARCVSRARSLSAGVARKVSERAAQQSPWAPLAIAVATSTSFRQAVVRSTRSGTRATSRRASNDDKRPPWNRYHGAAV